MQSGDEGWSEDDLQIGAQIENGDYAGLFVEEVIVLGGKFLSFAGGNRPAFVLDGVHIDKSREVYGSSGISIASATPPSGAFYADSVDVNFTGWSNGNKASHLKIASSRIVPTGPENSPCTLSERWWRRVA